MQKDNIFSKEIEKKFEFDEQVASVFDDMLSRSIPFYKENLELICNYLAHSIKPGDRVLDIGCSTGTFLLQLQAKVQQPLQLTGIDSSEAMIKRAGNKAKAYDVEMTLETADAFAYPFHTRDFIVCNYLLQFIRPMMRARLVEKIYDALEEGGIFVFSEKVIFKDKKFDKQIIDIYYEYKQAQGYSKTEIAQKREALENVLIPYTIEENLKMVKEAGFLSVETLFQWGNFVTFVAVK